MGKNVLQHCSGCTAIFNKPALLTPLSPVLRYEQRVWTSDQLFCPGGPPGGPPGGREFCSLLNAAIRADDPGLLEAVILHTHTHAHTHTHTYTHTPT